MLEQSLYKNNFLTLWFTTFFVLAFLCSGKVLSSDFGDQTTIVGAYLEANSEDRYLAQSLAKQARKRASIIGDNHNASLGPLVKLWCDAAVIAPDPDNLAECARLRFEAVGYMSNPQPSEEVVLMQRARESLIMIRAALEIAGGEPSVSDELRHRLKNDFKYFRCFILENGKSKNCK